MKVVVQIPCLNESGTLAGTIRDIPRDIAGVDSVEVVVIDDGSTDQTSEVAREAGADHLITFKRNRGLGHAVVAGFEASLKLGADIVVNTDGDNQYRGADIAQLVAPIIDGRADVVIGDRQTDAIEHFSPMKKRLQRMGSQVVGRLADVEVPDAASGFRAYSREAVAQLYSHGSFDHTVEHLIQAGQRRWSVLSVPIRTNPKARESRLFGSIGEFVFRSGLLSLRTYAKYRALTMFSAAGVLTFSAGFLLGLRFLYYFFFTDEGLIHVQSVILAAILLLAGFQMVLTGLVADLIGTNRELLEDLRLRVRKIEEADSDDVRRGLARR